MSRREHMASGGRQARRYLSGQPTTLSSSFYGDFENFEDDEDDDDDDEEYTEIDEKAMASFRSRMGGMLGETEDASEVEDDEEDDNEDDDDDETEEVTQTSFSSVDELISFATSASKKEPVTDWATPLEAAPDTTDFSQILKGGVVLVANPEKFCSDFPSVGDGMASAANRFAQPSGALLAKFGLTVPPPADLGPDRRYVMIKSINIIHRTNKKLPLSY
jgi:hypothetical protein